MHVEWELALPFQSFLLRRDLGESLNHDTLSQEFFLPAATTDILQRILRFVNEVCPEGAETDLDEGTIEKYLGIDVEGGNGLLQVRHKQHISSPVILVVESEVVDLA